ncbi:toxin secretion/phage lysis holin [Kineothrix alysoides]|uniref:Toxin secretion/phage lysis holin n=1 Tax=Kineothrix alysoides TaxID=1469948 RepID=A0A4R1QTS2_9FIRM|nr:phage holin family protein [Kineothrix alysoides]TCL56907.1 toxin secretion/phage lysis holin [Kineothrix alysoides]
MKTNFSLEKSIIAVLGAWISNTMELLIPTLMLLTILMVIDYISGMLAAKKEALEYPDKPQYRWSSKKSIIGIYKKIGYILTILVAVSTDYLIHKFAVELGLRFDSQTLFGLLVSIWFIINELLSILENANRMGVALPGFLVKVLMNMKNNVDHKGE